VLNNGVTFQWNELNRESRPFELSKLSLLLAPFIHNTDADGAS